MLGISPEQASKMAQKVVADGQEAMKPGWVRLDTNFIFSKYELEYIVKAIELVCLHAEKLLGFYVQEPSGQWNINIIVHNPSYTFGLNGVLQSPLESSEFELDERKSIFEAQFEQAMMILGDPHKYLYKLKQNGLLDVRNRVKDMFNRGPKTTEAKKEHHLSSKSIDFMLETHSPQISDDINLESFKSLGSKGKLMVRAQ
jgi:hypothetical protein